MAEPISTSGEPARIGSSNHRAGRYAPSPSGALHIGNLRTALLAWAFARAEGRPFVVRVEDIDDYKTRDFGLQQLEDLAALGLDWDGEVVWSSYRHAHYQQAIDQLTSAGLTYPCYCSRKDILEAPRAPHDPPGTYPGTCANLTEDERAERQATRDRPPAIRVRTNRAQVEVTDRLHPPQVQVLDDVVIQRFDGTPAYNLTVVVDDHLDGVGQVVRGDDLLPVTGRQIWLARHLGIPVPEYAHVPLVLNQAGQRLAKRDGAVTLADRLALGETVGDVIAAMATSLHHSPTRTAQAFLDAFNPTLLPRTPWVFA
ncbi:tRNA glutamyl-Q(34) synthetase GluQRS [Stomatohabitans albus]|uniref:tRNA glutamyl-Q(34) synthetase GluQRS n=1 Tax=Stomatohabitans albus TaxID=3110766 RepID=UPI00300D7538